MEFYQKCGSAKAGFRGHLQTSLRFFFPTFFFAFVLWPGSVTQAQIHNNTPTDKYWIPNDIVHAIAHSQDRIYIGGDFTYVGPPTGAAAPLDTATGCTRPVFPKANGTVRICIPDGHGGWYIGGEFTRVGNLPRNKIAHISSDYSVDPKWNPDASGGTTPSIYALAVSDSVVYAGGAFASIGGQDRNSIAALDAATGLATPWNPDATGVIYALAVSDSRIYAGGLFTHIGGQISNNLVALDATTGWATDWNPGADGKVNALIASGSLVYAAGAFVGIGGEIRPYLAALDMETGVTVNWNPNPDNTVSAISLSGSTLYVAGTFAKIKGIARKCIAALDISTGMVKDWNPQIRYGYSFGVNAIVANESNVYIGGFYKPNWGAANGLVCALDAKTTSTVYWMSNANLGSSYSVLTLALSDSTLYAGGSFGSIGGKLRNHIAALDAATGEATNWDPDTTNYNNETVYSLFVNGSEIFVGGEFGYIGGQKREALASVDTSTGLATTWDPALGYDSVVYNLTKSGTTLYIGGRYTTICGKARDSISAFDLTSHTITAWDAKMSNGYQSMRGVWAIAPHNNLVYLGGCFYAMGGQRREGLASVDATSGTITSWDPNPSGGISAFAISGSTLYVGGGFLTIGEQSRRALAAFDTSTGLLTDLSLNFSGGYVSSLRLYGDQLLLGGGFKTVEGQARNALASINLETGHLTPWCPIGDNSNNEARVLSLRESDLFVGGYFANPDIFRTYFHQFLPRSTGASSWNLYK